MVSPSTKPNDSGAVRSENVARVTLVDALQLSQDETAQVGVKRRDCKGALCLFANQWLEMKSSQTRFFAILLEIGRYRNNPQPMTLHAVACCEP